MITRHIETLFCDDIRHEMGGKISLIGVYSSGLFVDALPALLSKLCLSVKAVTPADQPFRSLTLRVFQDEAILQEIVLGAAELTAASDLIGEMVPEGLKSPVQVAQFMLVFSPLHIPNPCMLGVRVQTEDDELHGIALRVDQARPAAETT